MNVSTIRDFIYVHDASILISKICKYKPIGIYNLSSMNGCSVGIIGTYLIDGYGKGNIEMVNDDMGEQFILNNTLLMKTLDIDKCDYSYKDIITNIGNNLNIVQEI